jgi:RNA polymerase sigma factor (TIGR02999 family)
MIVSMTDVTRILNQIENGDPSAADELLPLVYEELRKLASQRLANEKPGQTLQATALVHEAYLRLIGCDKDQDWDNRGHFFAAAAESMRRILVESARRKKSQKAGGGVPRRVISDSDIFDFDIGTDVLELNDSLDQLAEKDSQAAELVKLRFFAGLTSEQAARVLAISPRTADRIWMYAKSFLYNDLKSE